MEIGRVVLVNYGPHEGKLAVIIDVADNNKVWVVSDSGLCCISYGNFRYIEISSYGNFRYIEISS